MSRHPKTIAVDFDGTLVTHNYPEMGTLKEGAREALQAFKDMGYQIMIWSCRTCAWYPEIFNVEANEVGTPEARMNRRTVKDMVRFLDGNGVPYDIVDDGSKGKPMADWYIDDKGIHFADNWPEIVEYIKARKAWM